MTFSSHGGGVMGYRMIFSSHGGGVMGYCMTFSSDGTHTPSSDRHDRRMALRNSQAFRKCARMFVLLHQKAFFEIYCVVSS